MGLIVVYGGLQAALAVQTADNTGAARIGLYQNDWEPQVNQTIAAVVPATFSGYAGLQALSGWTPPVLDGNAAYSSADEVLWAHDGGAPGNWIFGIYVVDGLGNLRWAERVWPEPIPMIDFGNFARYVPYLTQASKITGW